MYSYVCVMYYPSTIQHCDKFILARMVLFNVQLVNGMFVHMLRNTSQFDDLIIIAIWTSAPLSLSVFHPFKILVQVTQFSVSNKRLMSAWKVKKKCT